MTIYKGTVPIAGLAKNTIVNGFHIFDCKWADHLLEDISWLRADTFSWQSGSVYVTAYNELVSEYNSATDVEINAIKVGNPTVSSSGVVSGFSASNYVKLPNSLSFNSTSNIEIILKINTGTDISTEQQVIFGTNNLINNTLMITQKANKIRWNTYGVAGTDTITITQNQDLYIKITAISGTYTLYTSSNGTDWTSQGTKPVLDYSCIPFLGYTSGDNYTYFRGSIDLSESYIKINNSIWWSGEFCKRSPKGYKIVTADKEQAILNKYNTDGIAWYYILDTANTRFKLPRTKFGFEGLRGNVGDDISESLPNITGYNFLFGTGLNAANSGSLFNIKNPSGYNHGTPGGSSTSTTDYSISFDASRSSSTYQDNAPVQERATQMYLYFYVGEYAQTAIEQTAGITSEQLNNKLDANHGNDTKPYLKTTYVNGTSGYRIWADGFCEQWGSPPNTGGTITFLKVWADTNYCILGVHNGANAKGEGFIHIYNKKTTTADYGLSYSTSGMAYFAWRACGYLAPDQY